MNELPDLPPGFAELAQLIDRTLDELGRLVNMFDLFLTVGRGDHQQITGASLVAADFIPEPFTVPVK